MCTHHSCSENWRTNIKFSRLTLYFYIPGHTWTDWKIGANHIFQKYKLDRKLLREIEGYFTVKLIVCLLRWCLLRIVTLPSWMRSTVEMFLAKTYIGSFFWSFSEGIYIFPQFLVSANKFTSKRKKLCQSLGIFRQNHESKLQNIKINFNWWKWNPHVHIISSNKFSTTANV